MTQGSDVRSATPTPLVAIRPGAVIPPWTNHRGLRGVLSYVSIHETTVAGGDASVRVTRDRTEASLVERARRGDHDAFAALVDDRLGATFRTVLAVLGDEAEARDVTQVIFVRAWTNCRSSGIPRCSRHGSDGSSSTRPGQRCVVDGGAMSTRSAWISCPTGRTRLAARTPATKNEPPRSIVSSAPSTGSRQEIASCSGSTTMRAYPWQRSGTGSACRAGP